MMGSKSALHIMQLSSVHPAQDTRILHRECRSLVEAGYRVTLVANAEADFEEHGVRVLALPKISGGRAVRMTRQVWRVLRMAINENADAYHFHDPELIPVGLILRLRGKPVVYDVHESVSKQILSKPWIPIPIRRVVAGGYRFVEKLVSPLLSGIVAATPGVAEYFPKSKTIIVQNFPILSELMGNHGASSTQREPVVAYVGNNTVARGAREMVAAIAHLPADSEIRFEMGGPFSSEKLEHEVKSMQGAERTTFPGRLSRPTLVFATSTPLTIVFPALAIKLFRRVPMVFEVRDLWPEMPIAIGALTNPVLIRIARWMENLAYSQSTRVIALSPGMKEGVVCAGYPESHVVIVSNASDIESFQVDPQVGRQWLAEQNWYRGGPVLLYAGTLGLINDVSYLVELAYHARRLDPDFVVLIVGAGQEAQKIEMLSQELGVLGRNVVMLERVPKRDLPTVYSAATMASSTVAEIPNVEKNSANKFFDTLAAGRPIAINHGGWQEEWITGHDCGLRLPRSPEQAARVIVDFMSDAERVRKSGENAFRLAMEEFDRDKLYVRFSEALIAAEAD